MMKPSPAYKYCIANGGKVSVMKLSNGKTVNACVVHGKRYMGRVSDKKSALKGKSKKK